MKKIAFSLLLVFGIVLLTGCGKTVDFNKVSHLTCKKTEVNVNETTVTTMTFSYDQNEKLNDFLVESDTTYNRTMSKEAMNITAKAMKLISRATGLGFKSEVSENRLYFSFNGNIKSLKVLMKRLDKDYNEEKVFGDTKSEAITELAKEGYSCQDYKK